MNTLSAYEELVHEFALRPIRSERQLERATRIALRLAGERKLDRDGSDYLEVLSQLIETYEERHHALEPPQSGTEALKFLIDENGLTLTSLAAATGIRVSTLSEVISGRRSLNLTHVRSLANYFHVNPGLFIDPADVAGEGT